MRNVPGSFTMTYGKHKGEKFDNIPASYLLYMLETGKLYGVAKDYASQNKETLEMQVKNERKGIR